MLIFAVNKNKFRKLVFEIIIGLFAVTFIIQLYYYFGYFLKIATKKQVISSHIEKKQLPISIIVAAHNEIENLVNLIPLLLHQEYSKFEVIIVDDRSTDGTYDFLKEQTAKISNLRFLKVNETPEYMSPKKYAITLGIKAAENEHMLFLDADCMPASKNWIQQMAVGFDSDKQIVIGYSQYEKRKGFLNLFIRFETFLTGMLYLSSGLKNNAYMGVGRNLAYHKNVFFNNKGFHPFMKVLGGDDDLFINQVATNKNTAVVTDYEGQTISFPKTNFNAWYRQKKRHLSVGKYYNKKSKIFLGLFTCSSLLFLTFIPILTFHPLYWMIAAGTYVVRLLIQLTISHFVAKKLNDKIEYFLIPVLEIFYLFYIIIIGLISYRAKRIRWS